MRMICKAAIFILLVLLPHRPSVGSSLWRGLFLRSIYWRGIVKNVRSSDRRLTNQVPMLIWMRRRRRTPLLLLLLHPTQQFQQLSRAETINHKRGRWRFCEPRNKNRIPRPPLLKITNRTRRKLPYLSGGRIQWYKMWYTHRFCIN